MKDLTKRREHFTNDFEPITPGNNILDSKYTYISTSSPGNLSVESKSGNTITYTDVPTAFIPPLIPTKILTGTTAVVVGHFHNDED